MSFVPDLPVHPEGGTFGYYGDGMLGSFEHLKWPQVYYEKEPHAMAAPGNPKLVFNEALQSFPLHDLHGVLPKFPDPHALWCGFGPDSFERSLELPTESVGHITQRTADRLRAVAYHAEKSAKKIADKWFGTNAILEGQGMAWRLSRIRFIEAKLHAMHRTITRFREVPISSFDALMVFREAQRLILEVQAWIIYIDVIRPRLDNPAFKAGNDVLPLRGVFTGRQSVVETLYRVGVPVWWVRPRYTLTGATKIVQVREVILPSIHFSTEKVISHGAHKMKAPAWTEAKTIDQTMEQFGTLVQRWALSNEPTIQRAVAVLVEDRQPPDDAEVERNLWLHAPPPVVVDLPEVQDESGPSAEAAASDSRSRKRQKKGRHTKGRAGDATVSAPPKLERPEWMSPVSVPWEAALATAPNLSIPDRRHRLLYFLPPPHLFYSSRETLTQKMHNWLRIREWSMWQALSSVENRPVLMTISQWRIALEGRYFAVEYPSDATCQPQSSLSDIAKLPPPPHPTSSLGKRGEREATQSGSRRSQPNETRSAPRSDPRRLKRLMERVDINVRFGVHANLPPYHPDIQPLPRFMGQPIDRRRAATDATIWAGVAWELSYMNFRMELLALDMEIMPDLYDPEKFTGCNRQSDIMRIWNDSHVVWEKPGVNDEQDRLTADHWWDRRIGMGLFHSILSAWPVVEPRLSRWDGRKETRDGFDELERETVLYYCRRFHALRGRLPSLPLSRPPSIPPTIPPPVY